MTSSGEAYTQMSVWDQLTPSWCCRALMDAQITGAGTRRCAPNCLAQHACCFAQLVAILPAPSTPQRALRLRLVAEPNLELGPRVKRLRQAAYKAEYQ